MAYRTEIEAAIFLLTGRRAEDVSEAARAAMLAFLAEMDTRRETVRDRADAWDAMYVALQVSRAVVEPHRGAIEVVDRAVDALRKLNL